jgi:hypothetical protein
MTEEESFGKFKEKALHKKEELFAILFLSPITIRIAYLIKKYNLNISPNQVTSTRLFVLSPLIILCLFLAPFFRTQNILFNSTNFILFISTFRLA